MTEQLLAGREARPVPGIDNGFIGGYRVRFDEAGPDGRLRTAGLLRYAQDIAWRHSEAIGFDRRWYDEQGFSWVVRAVDLVVTAAIPIGATVRVETAVIGHRRAWARRRGEFKMPDGASAAVILTDWLLVDRRGRIVRIPPVFGSVFANPEATFELTRVAPPPPPTHAARLAIRVRPADLDPMGHVNNAVYLDWLDEAITTAGDTGATTAVPHEIRLEYAASAEAGDVLEAVSWRDRGGWWLRLRRSSDDAESARAWLGPPDPAHD